MSLETAGVWGAGVWASTVWADGVWREGAKPIWTQQTAVTTTWTPQTAASSYWIEQGYKNLVLNSEDFSGSDFLKVAISLESGQSDPEGGTAATKIIEDNTEAYHGLTSLYTNLTDNTVYTYSMFSKADERGYLTLVCRTKDNVYPGVTFNLDAGVVNVVSGVVYDYGIIDYGSFYRIYVMMDVKSGATVPSFYPQLFNSAALYTGDGSSGLIIWGMQLNEGTTLQPYSKTTGSSNTLTTWTEQ